MQKVKANALVVGAFIRGLRGGRGLSQTELGDALKVTQSRISRWEDGLSIPDVFEAYQVMKFFNLSMSCLHPHLGWSKEEVKEFSKTRNDVSELQLTVFKSCNILREIVRLEELSTGMRIRIRKLFHWE